MQRQCKCPGDPQTLSDELTKSITCRTDPGANTAREEEEKRVLTSAATSRLTMAFQLHYAFLHDTSDKEAKVTFLTTVDNSSGQMAAAAVQKKGHVKFVECFL